MRETIELLRTLISRPFDVFFFHYMIYKRILVRVTFYHQVRTKIHIFLQHKIHDQDKNKKESKNKYIVQKLHLISDRLPEKD